MTRDMWHKDNSTYRLNQSRGPIQWKSPWANIVEILFSSSQRILALNLPQLDPSDGWELYVVATGTFGIKGANIVLTGTRWHIESTWKKAKLLYELFRNNNRYRSLFWFPPKTFLFNFPGFFQVQLWNKLLVDNPSLSGKAKYLYLKWTHYFVKFFSGLWRREDNIPHSSVTILQSASSRWTSEVELV